jgi:hypothetical protein
VTSEVRSSAPFELLRFTAAPVSADIAIVELEGRFDRQGRFARSPVLVVEEGDESVVKLAPVRSDVALGRRWRASFAVSLSALDGGTFALGLRGTLLDLGVPDVQSGGDRFAALARETNALRRRLDRAEEETAAAREEVAAAKAATEDAVRAAHQAAEAEAAEKLAAAEAARAEAIEQLEAARRGDEEAAALRAQETEAEAEKRLEEVRAEAEARVQAAMTREAQAEERAGALQAHADTREAELAEERTRAQNALAEVQQALEIARAHERDLRKQLQRARAELEAQRREAGRPHRPLPETEAMAPIAGPGEEEAVEVVGDPFDDDDADDATRPMPTLDDSRPPPEADDASDDGESVRVIGRRHRGDDVFGLYVPPTLEPARASGPSSARWIALGALLLFAFVLLGLIAGFLG